MGSDKQMSCIQREHEPIGQLAVFKRCQICANFQPGKNTAFSTMDQLCHQEKSWCQVLSFHCNLRIQIGMTIVLPQSSSPKGTVQPKHPCLQLQYASKFTRSAHTAVASLSSGICYQSSSSLAEHVILKVRTFCIPSTHTFHFYPFLSISSRA